MAVVLGILGLPIVTALALFEQARSLDDLLEAAVAWNEEEKAKAAADSAAAASPETVNVD